MTQAAWPALIESGGSVINVASSVGSIGLQAFGFAARVNAITPGFIATPCTSAVPEAAREFVALWVNLLDDPIEPIDIAYCALYLASDESRFVTGADLAVDAGQPQAARPEASELRN